MEQYGTYEKNGIAFQDANEIWWLETIGGHHWIARRVPDDSYVVMPNQLGLDVFDLEDALFEQKEYMCSADMREFIEENHLNLSLDGSHSPTPSHQNPAEYHPQSTQKYSQPASFALSISGSSFSVVGSPHRQFI